LRAIGGSLANGFGIQLPITSSQISSVSSDYSFSGDLINFDEKGLESGQALATLIFFENGFKVLQHPGIGTGINTSNENPFVEPAEIIVSVVFTQGLTIQQLGNAPNNPFIFSSEIRGKEIHIPGYAPTSLVDVSYFGTEDDATNLETEYYYKTPRGLPWGMNIPTSFSYPVEKIPIIDGYSNFSQWATSGGYSFMDWYDDIEGYRVAGKLFIRPN
jgi:LruC domain-containing protein